MTDCKPESTDSTECKEKGKMGQDDACLSLGNNNNNNDADNSSKSKANLGGDVEQHNSDSSKDHQRTGTSAQFGKNAKTVKTTLNTSGKLNASKMKTIPRKKENHRQTEMSFPKDSLSRPVSLASNSNEGNGGSNPISKDGDGTTDDSGTLPEISNWQRGEERNLSCFRNLTTLMEGTARSTDSSTLNKESPGGTSKQVENNIDSDMAVVTSKEEFEGTTTSTLSSSSSFHHNNHLARVDPIVDFFTVDEELLGRFRICSYLSRQIRSSSCRESSGGGCISSIHGNRDDEGGTQQQQQAIIFKIKTTSPYSFWVRPIYGLMRPNVIAWVEVKCELKANNNSLAKLVQNMDEFLVEICPVPGAISTMTSDLYTSSVHSNLPELWNIWEKVEQELLENQQQLKGFVKEYHRVSCRFQRSSSIPSIQYFMQSHILTSSQSSMAPSPEQSPSVSQCLKNETSNNDTQMPQEGEMSNNNDDNNVKIFPWNSASACSTTAAPLKAQTHFLHNDHYPKSEECFHLAREFPYPIERDFLNQEQWESGKEEYNIFGRTATRPSRKAYLRAIKKLWCLSFILASLLFVSLIFLLYTQFYHHYYIGGGDEDDGTNKGSKKNLQTDETKHYFHNNNSMSEVSNIKSNKRDFYG